MITKENEKWLQAIKRVKRIVLFLIAFLLVISAAIRIMQFYNNEHVSFIDILTMILLLGVFFISKKWFNSYEETIAQLSESDLAELKIRNAAVPKWRSIFPAFIITADYVRVFQGVVQPTYYFNQITEIRPFTGHNRGGAIFGIHFKTLKGKNLHFRVNNYEEQTYLIQKVKEANPKIEINPIG